MITSGPANSDAPIRTIEIRDDLGGLTPGHLYFDGQQAALVIAIISPHFDFAETIQTLKHICGATPLVGVSTSGELCALSAEDTLYTPDDCPNASIILQVFSHDLLADVAIRSTPLFSEDLRAGKPIYNQQERVSKIANVLRMQLPHFRIDARDTLGLTFFEGLTNSDDYFMEAVYDTGLYPCPFAGGSAGTTPGSDHTYLYDNGQILENHAVTIFLKMAPGKRFSILKSQNFKKTTSSFIAVDADPTTSTVSTLLDPTTDSVRPATEAVAAALGVPQVALPELFTRYSFGIELDNEIFVRSINSIDLEKGTLRFYANINQGDVLFIAEPTDFEDQTRDDIQTFLNGKPRPLGVLLNDCIMRRLHNTSVTQDMRSYWPCPVAGFSTLGELLGISINQTLTAIAFFDETDNLFADPFVDMFPVHYARYQNFYRLSKLRRIEVMTRLRADMTRHLAHHLGASPELASHIESMLEHSGNLEESLNSIRMTISREVETEQRAERAEQRLVDAIEAMSEGFSLHDKNGYLIMTNSRLRDMYPLASRTFLPGRKVSDILTEMANAGAYDYTGRERNALLQERIDAHMNPDGQTTIMQIGKKSWITTRLNRTKDGDVVSIRSDISDQINRQMELERLKRNYEMILDTAGDGIIGIDINGQITFANPAACTTLRIPPEDMIGKHYIEQVQNETLPPVPSEDPDLASGEIEITRLDGSTFTIEYKQTPAYDGERMTGAVVIFRDITLRKKYESTLANQQKHLEQQVEERTRKLSQEIAARIKIDNALQASQQRLLGITSSLLEGVLLVDHHGIIVFANPSAHRWLDVDVLLEKSVDSIFMLEDRGTAIPFTQSPFAEVIRTGRSLFDNDAVFAPASGADPMSVAFSASLLNEGRQRQVVVISFRGIKALKDAQREAMQASRLASVGQLATGIAHEINTPIQYVGDNLHFIQDTFGDLTTAIHDLSDTLPQEQARAILDTHNIDFLLADYPDAISQALQGVDHVSHIVRSMKDFSHPGTTAKSCIDINQAIESTITVCRNEWKQLATMHTDLSENVGRIQCYAADLNQVLLNLIINAAHAIGELGLEGKGNIHVSSTKSTEWVEIRIADDGPGIPEPLRERIFAPFFTTKPVGKGTGQGLSICQDIIVKKHEGQLFLEETSKQGACFVIRLPAIDCI